MPSFTIEPPAARHQAEGGFILPPHPVDPPTWEENPPAALQSIGHVFDKQPPASP
ncbi:hypothetical protein HBB16_02370 [Pseudonocardia sp. MCCB 268]|nr:hypothetical protein [Pseudonocardia cytotoxica]